MTSTTAGDGAAHAHVAIVFLDIDGVINHPGTYSEFSAPRRLSEGETLPVPVDPACMARLNLLLAKTGAKVVISSSWRKFARWQELGPALHRHGLLGDVVSETPDLWHEARDAGRAAPARITRGMEIGTWHDRHPEVTAFAILDDDSDMEDLTANHVHTNGAVGLDDLDVERAMRLLVRPTGPILPSRAEMGYAT